MKSDFGDQLATRLATIENDAHFWKSPGAPAIKEHSAHINEVVQGATTNCNHIEVEAKVKLGELDNRLQTLSFEASKKFIETNEMLKKNTGCSKGVEVSGYLAR